MSWLLPRRGQRATEGLIDSIAASGAYAGGIDLVDPDLAGFRHVGQSRREVPGQTRTKTRALSVHTWRTNPMGRAIIDTYTSFCVGDSGVVLNCGHPDVAPFAEKFWNDPRNALPSSQDLLLRSHMLEGETALELMVGATTGITRYGYIEPEGITKVRGTGLWPEQLVVRLAAGTDLDLDVVHVDDITGLRTGDVMWWPEWRAVASDKRGYPFLSPVLDWLDAYDQVIWNLIDRTAIARHITWDVEIDGDQDDIDEFIKTRGGLHAPRSGSVEVHNGKVKWDTKTAQVGTYEDKQTAQLAHTNVAAGAGLSKPWLAEGEDANRAVSQTMAEPVRRRIAGVAKTWLDHMTDLTRFAVDRAVAAGRVPSEVEVTNAAGELVKVPAAQTVTITGPQIAATDAKVNADILMQLGQGLAALEQRQLLSRPAAEKLAEKAWEMFMGVPYDPKLADAQDADRLAERIEDANGGGDTPLLAQLTAV